MKGMLIEVVIIRDDGIGLIEGNNGDVYIDR